MAFGAGATLGALGAAAVRNVAPSADRNLIADYLGRIGDPRDLARRLAETPGVVEHGLFAPELVSDLLIGYGDQVVHRDGARSRG
jgi:ribose 5-phosphate isomerase A